jgi:tetratricopeptide (TPR) repeat protein
MDAHRFRDARAWLIALRAPWSDEPEVAYRLGVCEHARGDYPTALAAWARVPLRSPWGVRAGLARAKTLVGNLGRFADAEDVLLACMSVPPPERNDVRHTLSEIYFWEGRRDEMRRLLESDWSTSTDPASELRDRWRIDNAVVLLEQVAFEVERSARSAPDDDRVWLAKASLALETGRSDEAGALLDRCTLRRPKDPAIWRARLLWCRSRGDEAEVRRALTQVPDDRFTVEERLDLQAWFAARSGDRALERRALEQLVAAAPGETQALDRLATLAWDAGLADHARNYRRRKAVLDEAKDRYRRLLDGKLPAEHYAEMARLAETLGRRFEARGWWTLRGRMAPADREATEALTRLTQSPNAPPAPHANQRGNSEVAHLTHQARNAFPAFPVVKGGFAGVRTSSPDSPAIIPRFRDDAQACGLNVVFDNGRSPSRQIPETTAGGVAVLDYDGDGWLDVYVVQGGSFPPSANRPHSGDRLYHNRGDGTFEDVTVLAGFLETTTTFSHGVTVGDIDNDGDPDLFVTRWRAYALFRNRGDGTFEDATEQAGLGGDRDWPTSSAFADLDNDGDLDLYVCHYLAWDAEHPTLCPRTSVSPPEKRHDPTQKYNYCTPRPFPALPDHLFRNDDGQFVDVTTEAGLLDKDGRGLGVVAADFDEDGRVDLFVANDTTANYLLHNLGDMRFEEVGVPSGVACNAEGAFQAGMGTACGDLDEDGRPDLFVTNFYGESTTFFRNLGGGMFADQTSAMGLAAPTRFLLGFGIVLLDANADGHLDVAIANGHVNDDRPDYPYEMPAVLLIGAKKGRLTDVTQAAGVPWTSPRVARGLATGDLDRDGRVDVLVLAHQAPLAYFHNQTEGGHSIRIRLVGSTSNRDGIGAVVTVRSGGRRRRAWRYGGGSYQSASSPTMHFGLGLETHGEHVEVRWPSGRVDAIDHLDAERAYLVREGSGCLVRPEP